MAFWMGLVERLAGSCWCVVRWIVLTSAFLDPCVRRSAPSDLRRREGAFICWANVVWRWCSWPRRIGAAVNRVSVSGDSVASTRVEMIDCQAVHGAAACRCTAEPTPSPPIRNGRLNHGEVTSLPASCDQ